MKKVEVWWIDTIGYRGWNEEEDIDPLISDFIIKSIGYKVKFNKRFLIIAQSYDYGNKKWGNVTCIPRKAIQKIKS